MTTDRSVAQPDVQWQKGISKALTLEPVAPLARCSVGFEIGCDDDEKLHIAFALDCCGREALGFMATTEGRGEDVQDLIIAAVKARFGQVNRLPHIVKWLSDNGSGYA